MKRRIWTFGYWCNNLGDDLFLKVFSQLYPSAELLVLTRRKFERVYAALPNVHPVLSDTLFYRASSKALTAGGLPSLYYGWLPRTADAVVFLGGSIFMQGADWRLQFRSLEAAVHNCPSSFVVGANFGPYTCEGFYREYRRLFSKMSGVCFRDKASYALFRDLHNVRYAPDIVLNMKRELPKQRPTNYKDYYVISVIDLEWRIGLSQFRLAYESKMAEIALRIVGEGAHVIFMSFCEDEGDSNAIGRILGLLDNYKYQVAAYAHKEVDDSLMVVAHAKGIVATRLHAMILGFLYDIPTFPIAYSNKMTNVIEDYRFQCPYATVHNLNEVSASDVYDRLQTRPNIPCNILEQSKEQFSQLDGMFIL